MIAALNGVEVARLSVTRARSGRAVLRAVLNASPEDAGLAADAPASLAVYGVAAFSGAVLSLGRLAGLATLVARDAPGLEGKIPAKFYKGVDAGLVARDIVREAGEQGEVNLTDALAVYTRPAETAAAALTRLLAPLAASWRTTPAGGVKVARTAATDNGRAFAWGEGLYDAGLDGRFLTLALTPDLEPGEVIQADPFYSPGRFVVERLEHVLSAERLVTRAWTTTA